MSAGARSVSRLTRAGGTPEGADPMVRSGPNPWFDGETLREAMRLSASATRSGPNPWYDCETLAAPRRKELI